MKEARKPLEKVDAFQLFGKPPGLCSEWSCEDCRMRLLEGKGYLVPNGYSSNSLVCTQCARKRGQTVEGKPERLFELVKDWTTGKELLSIKFNGAAIIGRSPEEIYHRLIEAMKEVSEEEFDIFFRWSGQKDHWRSQA